MSSVGSSLSDPKTIGAYEVAATDIPGERCQYELEQAGTETGTATVTIKPNRIRVKIEDGKSETLYTVWLDFRNRAEKADASDEEAMADDYPIAFNEEMGTVDLTYTGEGIARGVAPAFATTAGVTSGLRLDKNGGITNTHGNVKIKAKLNYNMLEPGASPVVAADLVEQGASVNRVGGGWLRVYTEPVDDVTSVQEIDDGGLPVVARATVQGITIVGHTDFVTHGHTPGVGGTDHFSAFKGDFPADCLGAGDDDDD